MSEIITDITMNQIVDNVHEFNVVLRKFLQEFNRTKDWDDVQADVRSGNAKRIYEIGDELVTTYVSNGVEYELPWIVVDNDRECVWSDGTTHPGLWLQSKYAIPEYVPFDEAENEPAQEQTAQSGWHYFAQVGPTSFISLNLNTGDPVPHGTYSNIFRNSLTNPYVIFQGDNYYFRSECNQWLNSAANAGEWWVSQHGGDMPSQMTEARAGFITGLDESFLSVINPVLISVANNGAYTQRACKFFPASVSELYGVHEGAPNVSPHSEGDYFPYWKEVTGMATPNNSSNDARKVYLLDDTQTCVSVACRSSNLTSNQSNIWYVDTYGSISRSGVPAANIHFQPVCVVS